MSPGAPALPGECRWKVACPVSGRNYVARALVPQPGAAGGPLGLLIILDGHGYFASAAEMLRAHGAARDVILASLDYPDHPDWVRGTLARHAPLPVQLAEHPPALAAAQLERFYDLSLPAPQSVLDAESIPGLFAPRQGAVGGLDAHLDMVAGALVGGLAEDHAIDPARVAVFGHSLGGMAVLHALFTRVSFATIFIASSPSIWWNRRAVLAGEATFAERLARDAVVARLLVSVGAEEARVPILPARLGVDPQRLARTVRAARMVGNARDLINRLAKLGHGLEVAPFTRFAGLGHALAPFAALARGIAFAYPREKWS